MFSHLVENFLFNNAQMSGRNIKGITQLGGGIEKSAPNGFIAFFIILAVIVIKVLIVMISYNVVVPSILDSWGNDMSRFRPITFYESFFLVLLFNNLCQF